MPLYFLLHLRRVLILHFLSSGADWLTYVWGCFIFAHPACTSCSTGCASANVFNSLYCPRFFRSLLWFPVTLLLKVLEGKLKYGTPSVSPPHRQKRGGTSNGFLKLSKGQCCSHREISRMPIIYSSHKTPTIHCTRGKGLAVVWKK